MAVGADMGGTTFEISIIDKSLPNTTTWGGVTNYPIKLPMVDLKTIGAGGGSIAWVDEGGILNVGPRSSGSSPGPACYGWGGTLPTVSDSNLILGRLNPNYKVVFDEDMEIDYEATNNLRTEHRAEMS